MDNIFFMDVPALEPAALDGALLQMILAGSTDNVFSLASGFAPFSKEAADSIGEIESDFLTAFSLPGEVMMAAPTKDIVESDCGCPGRKSSTVQVPLVESGLSASASFTIDSVSAFEGGLPEPENQPAEEATIVVTGVRVRTVSSSGGGSGGGEDDPNRWRECGGPGGYYMVGDIFYGCPEGPIAPPPPAEICLDLLSLTPAERDRVLIALEAAEIAREILAIAPEIRDYREYASLIYRTSAGVITHTPLSVGGPTSVAIHDLTPFQNGEGYGGILAMVHSHPALGYDPGFPEGRLRPTPDSGQGDGQGDWAALDFWANAVRLSLTSQGVSSEEALARSRTLMQFVVGAVGPSYSNLYAIRGYDFDERTGFGDDVPLDIVACDE